MATRLIQALAGRLLQAMSDQQFRVWANRIITIIAGYFVAHGAVLAAIAATAH